MPYPDITEIPGPAARAIHQHPAGEPVAAEHLDVDDPRQAEQRQRQQHGQARAWPARAAMTRSGRAAPPSPARRRENLSGPAPAPRWCAGRAGGCTTPWRSCRPWCRWQTPPTQVPGRRALPVPPGYPTHAAEYWPGASQPRAPGSPPRQQQAAEIDTVAEDADGTARDAPTAIGTRYRRNEIGLDAHGLESALALRIAFGLFNFSSAPATHGVTSVTDDPEPSLAAGMQLG
jgi:hypothetical protein